MRKILDTIGIIASATTLCSAIFVENIYTLIIGAIGTLIFMYRYAINN